MKIINLFYIIIFFSNPIHGQQLTLNNQKSIGGNSLDLFNSVLKTPDNSGFYLVGTSDSDISGDKTQNSRGFTDIWVMKTDLNFNPIWDKTFGGDLFENLIHAVILDTNIFVVCQSSSGISGDKTTAQYGVNNNDIWLICLDLSGNLIWQKSYGGSGNEEKANITTYSDSSLLITSISSSNPSGNKTTTLYGNEDYWLVEIGKTDGHIITQKSIGTNPSDYLDVKMIAQKSPLNNHTYAIGCAGYGISGSKTDIGFGQNDAWVLELDENLNIVQDKCFGGTGNELRNCNLILNDNNVFISVSSESGISGNKTTPNAGSVGNGAADIWLLKLNQNLAIQWDKSYGGNFSDFGEVSAINYNGNIVLSSYSNSQISGDKTYGSFNNSYDAWVIITYPNGNILTQNVFGNNDDEIGYGFIENPYNTSELLFNYASSSNLSGNKTVPGNGNFDAWLAKIDASNFLNTEKIDNSSSTISVYPNPFTDQLNFEFGELPENAILTLYSLDGKKIIETTIAKGNSTYSWSPKSAEQFFIYQLKGNSFLHQGKVVKK